MSSKVERETLSRKELEEAIHRPFYEPGKPYLWVLGFGWGIVGFYVRHETPLKIRVCHASYFHQAHKSWADLARTGGASNTEWRYLGDELVTDIHVIHVAPYHGEVHRGTVVS